jgi:hypothetical protein
MKRFGDERNKPRSAEFQVQTVLMHIHFFELHYAHLPDSDDAVKVFGTVGIKEGIATVGDIRKACEGHPKDASIYPKPDGSGFRISDLHGTGFVR